VAGTNLVAAKQMLVTRLRARPGLAGVDVAYSEAQQKHLARERVSFGVAKFTHTRAASSGAARVPRNEVVRLPLYVQVHQLGTTPEAADLRAVEMGREVEEELADSEQLYYAVPGLSSARVEGGELAHAVGEGGSFWSDLTYNIIFESHYIR